MKAPNDGGDQRCNLRWHNEVQTEKEKVETLKKQMEKIAKKAIGSVQQERDIALEELYVSGREEELEFPKATPSTNIRNLMKKQRDKDAYNRGRIGKKTSPNWDSETRLGRDMDSGWENMEQPASSGKQQMVVRQTEPPSPQICQQSEAHSDRFIPLTAMRYQPLQLNNEDLVSK